MEYGTKLAGVGQFNQNQTATQQVQYGVASGYKDLQSAVDQIINTVDNLRSCMGISIPKVEQGNAIEIPTLATQLRQLARILGYANADLTEVLVHLNS